MRMALLMGRDGGVCACKKSLKSELLLSCSTEYTFTSIISFIRHRASFHLLPPFRHDVTEPGGKSCSPKG